MKTKTADQWLSEYARTHRNPINKRIHYVCVPLIFWSVTALLWITPKPSFASDIAGFNWATVFVAVALGFYWKLGLRSFFGMLAVSVFALLTSAALQWAVGFSLAWIAGGIFIAAWIGQFYGHKIEGAKPSFLEDLLFLLIGPLWIVEQIMCGRNSIRKSRL